MSVCDYTNPATTAWISADVTVMTLPLRQYVILVLEANRDSSNNDEGSSSSNSLDLVAQCTAAATLLLKSKRCD